MRILPKESHSSVVLRKARPLKFLATLTIILVILSEIEMFFSDPELQGNLLWPFLFVNIIGFSLLIYLYKILDRMIEPFRKGQEGEKEVLEMLKNNLPDDYSCMPNFIIPKTLIGDIDELIIGPKGIIILEVKNYKGYFRICGGEFFLKLKGALYFLYFYKNPIKQVIQQRNWLSNYLEKKGLNNITIHPIVVLVSGNIEAIIGQTGVWVTKDEDLVNYILTLPNIVNFSDDKSRKISEALLEIKSVNSGQSF